MSASRTALAVTAVASLLCATLGLGAGVVGGSLAFHARSKQQYAAQLAAEAAAAEQTRVAPTPRPTEPPARAPIEATPAPGPRVEPSATPSPGVGLAITERQLRIWRRLWDIVHARYVYPDYNGVDWPGLRASVEAEITAGISDTQFYDRMEKIVDSLNDDHSSFQRPDIVQQEDARRAGSGAYVGIGISTDVNKAKSYVYVLQVRPGGPAETAGIRPHDRILLIDGKPSVTPQGTGDIARIRGAEGSSVVLTVQTPGLASREVIVTRASVGIGASVEYHMLPGSKKIGYIMIPTFIEDNLQRKVRAALTSLMADAGGNLDGLIVDVRLNGGGSFGVLIANLGFFTSGALGSLVARDGAAAQMSARPERVGNSQTVPLVVLTGRSTASAAEVFAGSLQAKGRAALAGAKSAGNIEALTAHPFEDGSVAWIAEQAYKLPDGSSWEGKGLEPNLPVAAEWDEFTGANDPVIEAAAKSFK